MNRLELVQRLHHELARGPGLTNTQPTSTESQTGDELQLVNWIDRAWEYIQNKQRYWAWRHKINKTTLDAGEMKFDMTSHFSDWENWMPKYHTYNQVPYIWLQDSASPADPRRIPYWEYETMLELQGIPFHLVDDTAVTLETGKPTRFTFFYDKQLLILDKLLDTNHDVIMHYSSALQVLDQDGDVPEMPARYHMTIVYRAGVYYAKFRSDDNLVAYFEDEWKRAYRRLCNDQLPNIHFPMEDVAF